MGDLDRWNLILDTPRGVLVERRHLMDGPVIVIDHAIDYKRTFVPSVWATLFRPKALTPMNGFRVWGHPLAQATFEGAGARFESLGLGIASEGMQVPLEATATLLAIEKAVEKGGKKIRVLGVDSSFSFHELQALIAMRVAGGLKLGIDIEIILPT